MHERQVVSQEVQRNRKEEVSAAMKKMKTGMVVGPGDIPVQVWRRVGERTVDSGEDA